MSTGYDYDRATLTDLFTRLQIPERSARESDIYRDFLAVHVSEYERYSFTVRVGQGRTPDPTHLDGVQRNTVESSKLKIDMLAWQGPQPFIFEVKERANHHAIGQLLTYRHLFLEDYPDAREPRLAVIARTIEPDMERIFDAEGITVYLYPPAVSSSGTAVGGASPPDHSAP